MSTTTRTVDSEVELQEVIEWVTSQELGVPCRWTLGPSTKILTVRGDDGELLAATEVRTICMASMTFKRDACARATLRSYQILNMEMKSKGTTPLVFVEEKSPLASYAGKLLQRVFEGCKAYITR